MMRYIDEFVVELTNLFEELLKLFARDDVDDVNVFSMKRSQLEVRPLANMHFVSVDSRLEQFSVQNDHRQVELREDAELFGSLNPIGTAIVQIRDDRINRSIDFRGR